MQFQVYVAFVLPCLLSFASGCTTQSYAPTTDGGTLELRIKAGDEIRIVTTRRERLTMEVSEVRGDRFVGVTVKPRGKELRPAGEAVEIPFDELAILEVTRFDSERATLASAAALVTVSIFAVVLGTVPPMLPPGP